MLRGEIRLYRVVKEFSAPGTPGMRKRKEKSICNLQGEFL